MKAVEMQMELIQIILETKNVVVLKKLSTFAHSLREQDDWWDELTEQQKSFVGKSARQVDEGKVVPNALVREEIKQRLRKS